MSKSQFLRGAQIPRLDRIEVETEVSIFIIYLLFCMLLLQGARFLSVRRASKSP
jgi:hypothetical protein